MKILVAEPLTPVAMESLRAQPGWDVVVADPKTYENHLVTLMRCLYAARSR